ncbi:MAG: hypothetical protein H6747_05780 [Deltaproteobacteria bacterium]|nr:hypothetical protein [Deltaproteobacteria bacterium]
MQNNARLGIFVWVLVLLMAGCGSDGGAANGGADSTADAAALQDTAQADVGGADTGQPDTSKLDTGPADAGPCPIDFAPCDDGEACTIGDRCVGGACQGGLDLCECQQDADCAPADLCAEQRYCDTSKAPYRCAGKPGTAVVCDKGQDTVCSKSVCDPKTGSCAPIAAPDGTPCQDGDLCTAEDACQGGNCKGSGKSLCACQQDADCAKFDDGNACNGTLYCDTTEPYGSCKVNPATVVLCSGENDTVCSKNACHPADGSCKPEPTELLVETCVAGKGCSYALGGAAGKVECDDGDGCTKNDVCKEGSCSGGAFTCGCAVDADCDAQEDGDLCNGTLYCDQKSSKCVINPATVISCPTADNTTCTVSACVPSTGQCVLGPVKNGTPCNDGDKCTGDEICLGGSCVGTTNTCPCKTNADCKDKDDGNLCNGTLFCDPKDAVCKHNASTMIGCPSVFDTACEKNACVPLTGECTPTAVERTLQTCDLPGNACRREVLPEKESNTGPHACSDGDACTVGDLCKQGGCQAGTFACYCKSDADCADDGDLCNGTPFCDKSDPTKPLCKQNPATAVTCPTVGDTACVQTLCIAQSGKCKKTLVDDGAACQDGSNCTAGDFCLIGECKPGKLVCPCQQDADCKDDGDLCNGLPYCDLSDPDKPQCKPNPAGVVFCNDSQDTQCLKAKCNPKSGDCALQPVKDGTVCDDGTVCTSSDACAGGACKGSALDCDDGKACTLDACDPKTGCSHTTKGCDDGNACTLDVCDAKTGTCVADKSSYVGKSCNADDDACTVGDTCQDGACVAGPAPKCDKEGGACDVPKCVSTGAVTFTCVLVAAPDGSECADGAACKVGAKCKSGACVGGGADTLFHTEFGEGDKATWGHVVTPIADGAMVAGVRVAGDGSQEWVVWRLTKTGAVAPGWPQVALSGLANGFIRYISAGSTITLTGHAQIGNARVLRHVVLSADGKSKLVDPGPLSPPATWINDAASDGVGGVYAAGSQGNNGALFRIAANGSLGWQAYDGGTVRSGYGVAALAKGGAILVGRGWTTTANSSRFAATFFDGNKAVTATWLGELVVGQAVARELRVAAATPDGGALAAGTRMEGGAPLLSLVRLDAAGKELWQVHKSEALRPWRILPHGKGWVLAGGTPGSLGGDLSAIAVDATGLTLWKQQRSGAGYESLIDLVVDGPALLGVGDGNGGVGAPKVAVWRFDPYGHDTCDSAGICFGKSAGACDDGNPCTNDGCDGKLGCTHIDNTSACEDGDACTTGDSCVGGTCKAGPKTTCDDNNPCTANTCDGKAGCVYPALADLTPCGDEKACIAGVCAKRFAVRVSMGDTNGLAVGTSGLVHAWGACGNGGCGVNGSVNPPGTLQTAQKIKDMVDARVGGNHGCGFDTSGKTWCWGYNSNGQIGLGTSSGLYFVPEFVLKAPNTASIDVHHSRNCAVDTEGAVRCWGRNTYSALGQAGSSNVVEPTLVADMPGKVAQVAVGEYATCVRLVDGKVACWGNNSAATLGQGSESNVTEIKPQLVAGLVDTVDLTCGHAHCCAVDKAGDLKCWGYNGYGQLGDGSKKNAGSPVAVYDISKVAQVDAAMHTTCAVLQDHTLRCWGQNSNGQMGTGDTFDSTVPMKVTGVDKVEQVAMGVNTTCIVLQTGEVRCCGLNTASRLGLGHGSSPVKSFETVLGSAP